MQVKMETDVKSMLELKKIKVYVNNALEAAIYMNM